MKQRLTIAVLVGLVALGAASIAIAKEFVGPGADVEFGGAGNDRMHAVFPDNQVDTVDCGAGYDIVFLNRTEHDLTDDCEVVRYVTPRASADESADTDD